MDKARSASDDPIDGTILFGAGDVFILGFPIVVGEEVSVGDGIDIGMSWGFNRGSNEVGFMSLGVGRERVEEFL